METKLDWIYESELKIKANLQKITLEEFLTRYSDVYVLWENSPYETPENKVYKVLYENFDKVEKYLK